MKRALAAAALTIGCILVGSAGPVSAPGRFDYYVLALSWSPTYCASPAAARRDPLQCKSPRGFIVHGLWPEFENGWPRECPSNLPRAVPLDQQRAQLDLTPSPGLIVHEWQAHGLCTGLSQRAYFEATRRFRGKVRIPAQFAAPSRSISSSPAALRASFVKTNRALSAQGLAISCQRNRLEEVFICFSKEGAFRRCGPAMRDRCPSGTFTAPANAAR